jgi:hypothetical protein
MRTRLFPLLFVLCAGCIDTSQRPIDLPLRLVGTAPTDPLFVGDWTVTLTEARLAFGPLYLCAGVQAGTLCETARAEWLGSAVVDTLSETEIEAGRLRGVSGPVRSYMYDLGITSLLTQQSPLVLDAAAALGGSSLVLRGTAIRGTDTVRFGIDLPVHQEAGTEIGVSVVRKSGSDPFSYELTGGESGLTLRFDARAWVSQIDFAALPPGLPVSFTEGTQGYRAIRGALVAGARPRFEWR